MPETKKRSKILKWSVKDATRGYWHITAKNRGTLPSETEENFYETFWLVQVKTEACQPSYTIEFNTETQYDQEIDLDQIVREIHEHIMLLYDAALLNHGVAMGRRFEHVDERRQEYSQE